MIHANDIRKLKKQAEKAAKDRIIATEKAKIQRDIDALKERPKYIKHEYDYIAEACAVAAKNCKDSYLYTGMYNSGLAFEEVIELLSQAGFAVKKIISRERSLEWVNEADGGYIGAVGDYYDRTNLLIKW